MSDDCNVCKVNSTYLVLSKVNFQATVSPNLLLNIAPTKIWNGTIFLYTKPNSTSAIPNLFGFMQFVARSHLGNGIFANNNIWMKPQKVKIAEVHNENVRQQNTCPKILKCFCFPKIWVIHLDKLYYIFYCLHSNNTCWLFFHIVDHYKVTDMFELFQQFLFYFLIDFRKGIFYLISYYSRKYQRLNQLFDL